MYKNSVDFHSRLTKTPQMLSCFHPKHSALACLMPMAGAPLRMADALAVAREDRARRRETHLGGGDET